MRGPATIVALLLTLSLASTPAASETTEPRGISVTDPPGDVKMDPNAQDAPEQFDYVDLLGFWMGNETLFELEVGLQLAELQEPSVPTAGGSREVGVTFNFGNAVHTASFSGGSGECAGSFTSRFENSVYGRCIAGEVDQATGIVRLTVPREYITNETFVMFGSGHLLEGVHATSSVAPQAGFAESRGAVNVYDRVPDNGVAGDYESLLGNETRSGFLRTSTPEPVRLSNGESTTLVYPVTIYNEATYDDAVLLSVNNVEPAWSIRAPPRVNVPANSNVTVPVILSMGFEHRHGQIAYFDVKAQSSKDPQSWSQLDLGVFWLDTPQPAGHHNKLFFHSGPVHAGSPFYGFSIGLGANVALCEGRPYWMNPLETDDTRNAEEQPVAACSMGDTDVYPPSTYATDPESAWFFSLVPELLIGLDFDVSQTALLTTAVRSATSATSAELKATLFYCDPGNATGPGGCVLAPIANGTSGASALTAGQSRAFDVELVMDPIADILPYKRNSGLVLGLRLLTDTPSHPPNMGGPGVGPELVVADSELILPLVEYHDPIDQAFQAVGTLHLDPLGAFEKPVNPGRTSMFRFDVRNDGAKDQALRVSLEGPNADWARVLPSSELTVAAKQRTNITIVVEAPADALPGERAELFIVMESVSDPNVIAISRLRASIVDPAVADIPNEDPASLEGGNSNGTPGPDAVAAALAIAISIAIVRRRRR